jgi:hypothetical protein
MELVHATARPALCIVAQGAKRVMLGREYGELPRGVSKRFTVQQGICPIFRERAKQRYRQVKETGLHGMRCFPAEILVCLGNADGEVIVLDAAKEKKLLFQTTLGSSVYSSFVPANGMLFMANLNTLCALALK